MTHRVSVIAVRQDHGVVLVGSPTSALGDLHSEPRGGPRPVRYPDLLRLRHDLLHDTHALQEFREHALDLGLLLPSQQNDDAAVVEAVLRAIEQYRLIMLSLPSPSQDLRQPQQVEAVFIPPHMATEPTGPVSGWSAEQRIAGMLRHVPAHLTKDLRAAFNAMISGRGLITLAVSLAVVIGLQFVGAGELLDAFFVAWAWWQAGTAGVTAIADLAQGTIRAGHARSEAELDGAAALFAKGVETLGIAVLNVIVARAASRGPPEAASSEGAGGGAGGGAGAGAGGSSAASDGAGSAAAEEEAGAPADSAASDDAANGSNPCESTSSCGKEGEPVNPATGAVFSNYVDFTLPGIVPLVFERTWTSTSSIAGELGYGWHHSLDMALSRRRDGAWALRLADGRLAVFAAPTSHRPTLNVAEQMQLWTDGRDLWVTDFDGRRFGFGPPGPSGLRRLTRISDPNGNGIGLRRDEAGNLTSILAGGGRRLTVRRDPQNRIAGIDGPAPDGDGTITLLAFEYDARGDLAATSDAAGAGFRYAYANHLMTEIVWPAGAKFRFEYDDPARGHAARCVLTSGDGDLFLRRFTYDLAAGTTTVQDGRGATRVYQWNSAGRITAQTDGLGRRTTFERDEHQRIVRETRADGAVRERGYDGFGRLVQTRAFDGGETVFGYPPPFAGAVSGQPTSVREPGNRTHRFAYDGRGNLTEYVDPAGRRRRYLRETNGLTRAVVDGVGLLRAFAWAADGQVTRESTRRGVRVEYAYDRLGRVAAVGWAGEQPTRFLRDAAGNLVEVVRSDGGRVRLGYDAERRITLHRDATGNETRWEYGGLPSPLRRINPDGSELQYRYDTDLNLVGLVNPKGEEYRLGYDLAGQLVEEVGFDGRHQAYEYNDAGHLARHIDEEGRGGRYRRDPSGRVLERQFGDGTANRFEYDPAGFLVAAENASRKLAFRYDRSGALTEAWQDDLMLRHEYDARGRRVLTELPDGRRVAYGWGEDDGFVALGFGGRQVAAITRDVGGRETERRAGTVVVASSYDPQGRLVRQSGLRDAARVLQRTYDYDLADRILAVDDLLGGARRYVYDPCERLVGVNGDLTESFSFDPAGNILGEAGQTGGSAPGDRLMLYGDRKFEYDSCGNRVRELRGAGGGVEVLYEYGPDNQLRAVAERDRRGVRRTTFAYDALGRRISKHHVQSRQAAANDGGGTLSGESHVCFLWDGDLLLAEGQSMGRVLDRVYLHEPDTFRPIAVAERGRLGTADDVAHYHLDHLGTPREVTNDNGAVIWQASLKAWGAVATVGVAEVANPLRFQGQYCDAETGLHYNRFRYYSPGEGRFIHEDPIRLHGGENLAAYAPNPVSWVDPFGLNGDPATATHITYVGVDSATGKTYVGYASMQGQQAPQDVLSYRYGGNFDRFGGTAPNVVYSGYGQAGKATARGLEQRYFEQYGGLDGTANLQNPVGPTNPRRTEYLEAADNWLQAQSGGGCG